MLINNKISHSRSSSQLVQKNFTLKVGGGANQKCRSNYQMYCRIMSMEIVFIMAHVKASE